VTLALRELETLVQRGIVRFPSGDSWSGGAPPGAFASLVQAVRRLGAPANPLEGHVEPEPAVLGGRCYPDNLPDDVPDDLVCQLSDRPPEHVQQPGRFLNAKKGDIVLSPGNGTLIAEMLRQVNPPQN
jgi:hypothetical protein